MSSKAPKLSTIEDLLRAPDRARLELVNGVIVSRSSVGTKHSAAQASLLTRLGQTFGSLPERPAAGSWWFQTEVLVQYNPTYAFFHDLVGWRRERVPKRPTGMPETQVPDWVCEILCASSAKSDRTTKKWALHRFGVPNLWLADPEEGLLSVFRWHEAGYIGVCDAQLGELARLEPFEIEPMEITALMGIEPDLGAGI